MPVIVACGPESNGTRLLTRILKTSGEDVVHRSLPHGEDWWHYSEFPKGTTFVAIFRDVDVAVQSAIRNGHITGRAFRARRARDEQLVARGVLLEIPHLTVVRYEDLIANPEATVNKLGSLLGLSLRVPEEIFDADAKYKLS